MLLRLLRGDFFGEGNLEPNLRNKQVQHPFRRYLLLGWVLSLLWPLPGWGAAPAGQWWDLTYFYRQKVTLTTGATPPVNRYNGYSVLQTLDTATLIAAGKMQSTCSDLRLLWWNGAAWVQLDRDVQGCNTAGTQVWFKLQTDISDSASDDNYYIYYGNASAPAGPVNKNNVYLYYDDFESYAIGAVPTGWTVLVGNVSVQTNAVTGSKSVRMDSATAGSRINLRRDITPTEADILVEADCMFDGSATANRYCGPGARWSGTGAADETGYMTDIRYNTNGSVTQRYVAGTWTGIGTFAEAVTPNTVYRVRLTLRGSALNMYRDGVLKLTNTDTSIAAANMLGIDAYNGSTGAYEFLDNFLARRYTNPEPTTTSAAEEAVTLNLVKQAWLVGGSAPLALTNGTPASATVPSGQTIVFLIYVKNSYSAGASDVRFSDLLDVTASGFSYVVNSLVRTSATSPPPYTASDLTIFNATAPGTGTALTDAVDGDVASICDTGAGSCPGPAPNRITVGNTSGIPLPSQANGTLSIAASSIFAIRFQAVKQ